MNIDTKAPDTPTDALLLIAPACPHCSTVLEGLSALVKEGVIGRLEIVNIAAEPDRARSLGVASVPWTRIGPFELEGLHSPGELRRWAERCARGEGLEEYFDDLLKTGQREKVELMVKRRPNHLVPLIGLLGDPAIGINTRIGVMAVLEELENTELAADMVEPLAALTRSEDPRIRIDACHALSLTGSEAAVAPLEACLNDPHRDVRETAEEALEDLAEKFPRQWR